MYGSLVPLPCPAASHEGRLIRDHKECLKFASEVQHRAWGEMVDRDSKVQGAIGARSRSARAIAEDMGLGPKPVTDRTRAYLGVRRERSDFLVFTVPTEVPEGPEALNALTEWLAPLEPRGGVRREMGVGPNRGRPPLRTEMVSVGPIGESPVVTYHGT